MRSATIIAVLGVAAGAVAADCNSSAGDGLRSFTACGTIQAGLSTCDTLSGNPQTACTCGVYSSQSNCYGSWSSQYCAGGGYTYRNDFMSGNCGGSVASATAAVGSASSRASSVLASATSRASSAASRITDAAGSVISAIGSAGGAAGSAAGSAISGAASGASAAVATKNAGVSVASLSGNERFVFAAAGVLGAAVGGLAVLL